MYNYGQYKRKYVTYEKKNKKIKLNKNNNVITAEANALHLYTFGADRVVEKTVTTANFYIVYVRRVRLEFVAKIDVYF